MAQHRTATIPTKQEKGNTTMQMTTIAIEGISALLCNAPRGMMEASRGPKTAKERVPLPEVEAELGCYWGTQGGLCLPTLAFRKCLIAGAKGRKVGRTGLNTILAGAVFPGSELTDLADPNDGKPLTTYIVDSQRAVPPGQGAVIRSRPRMDVWAAELTLEYDENQGVDEALIRAVLADGGSRVGVGNFRPEKGGMYGRFIVLDVPRWTTPRPARRRGSK